jgi:hypothetical protein
MRPLDVAGGWYVRALPTGQVAVLVPGKHIETHEGNKPLPFGYDNLLFPDITIVGGFRIAGQSHSGAGNVEFAAGEWHVRAPSYGTNPVAYDRGGRLYHGDPAYGAQGIRYFDENNQPVTADATYADPARRIGEWTQLGDITVGQSAYNLVILYRDQRFVLAEGVGPQNIHFDRAGDACVVSWYDVSPTVAAHVRWFTASEILGLPVESVATPPPVEPPAPPKEPTVEPIKFPARVQVIVETLYERNLKLAESPHDDDRRILARMIAEQVRFELGDEWGWKSNHGVGVSPSKDAIAQRIGPLRLNERQPLHIWDLFNGDSRKPYTFPLSKVSEQFFIPVEPVNHLAVVKFPEPKEPKAPSVPNVGSIVLNLGPIIEPLLAEIDALKTRVAVLENKVPAAAPAAKLPTRIALKADNGRYLSSDFDKGEEGPVHANRDRRGGWETFSFEVVE